MRFLKWAIIFILFNSAFLESKEGYADNDGVEIFYVDYGPIDNEPILLVQGLGGQLTFGLTNLFLFFKTMASDPLFMIIETLDYLKILKNTVELILFGTMLNFIWVYL